MKSVAAKILGAAMLASLQAVLVNVPMAQAQTTIGVASTASLYPQFYPLAIADEKGLFKKENIVIKELATSGGGATVAPVISGDTPIGLASMSATILARLEGAPIKVISGVSANFLSTIVYAVNAESKIKELSQLAGQNKAKIGYTSGGSITDTASAVMVRAEKLREGTDVERVALGSMQAATAALLTRQIEVEVANVNAVADYVVKGKLRIVGDTSDYMKNYEANAIIVNADYLAKNKEAIRHFLRAYTEAATFGNANKSWVQALYAKRAKVTPEAASIVLKKLEWTTKLDYDGFVNQLNLLKANGDVKKDVDAKKLYDGLVDLSLLP